jgi:hypothetical protein
LSSFCNMILLEISKEGIAGITAIKVPGGIRARAFLSDFTWICRRVKQVQQRRSRKTSPKKCSAWRHSPATRGTKKASEQRRELCIQRQLAKVTATPI